MKVVGGIVALITLVGGWYIGKDWWAKPITTPRIVALIGAISLILICYFVSVAVRLRRPMLKLGRLEPDLRPDSHQFQLRVTNRGPGAVRPKIQVTNVTDGNGVPLLVAYSGWEVHWRGVPKGERPLLEEGDGKYAGILFVADKTGEHPRLCMFPIDHFVRHLWDSDQPPLGGIQLMFTVSCQSEESSESILQTERIYQFRPDSTQPLRYSFRRRRFWPFLRKTKH